MKIYTAGDEQSFFQYVLYQNGDIQINYKSVYPRERTLAGIENADGTEGVGYDLGTSNIQNTSILYTQEASEPDDPEPEPTPTPEPEPEEYITQEYLENRLSEMESWVMKNIEKLEKEQSTKWAVYADNWVTGIAFYNPTDSNISTTVHIGEQSFNLTVDAGETVKKAITEYIQEEGEYIISVDDPNLILAVPMAYINTLYF